MVRLAIGVLALIVDGPHGENLGRTVIIECLGECGNWSVIAAKEPLIGVDHETGELCGLARSIMPEKWLMPVEDIECAKVSL